MATQEKNLSKSIEGIENSLWKFQGLPKKDKIFNGDYAGV